MSNKAIDKIKKLLRLAKSSNPHEAALALERAQKLMNEHNIRMDAPELHGVNDETITSKLRAQTPPAHIAGLFQLVTSAFGCDGYFQPTFMNMEVVFIGHDHRPKIAGYAFTVLERQLSIARKDFVASLSKRMKRANKTARADQFCEGWIVGVQRKVKALVLSDEELAQIDTFKSGTDLESANVRKSKASGAKANEARFKGYQAAQKVVLNQGVQGEDLRKLEAS